MHPCLLITVNVARLPLLKNFMPSYSWKTSPSQTRTSIPALLRHSYITSYYEAKSLKQPPTRFHNIRSLLHSIILFQNAKTSHKNLLQSQLSHILFHPPHSHCIPSHTLYYFISTDQTRRLPISHLPPSLPCHGTSLSQQYHFSFISYAPHPPSKRFNAMTQWAHSNHNATLSSSWPLNPTSLIVQSSRRSVRFISLVLYAALPVSLVVYSLCSRIRRNRVGDDCGCCVEICK